MLPNSIFLHGRTAIVDIVVDNWLAAALISRSCTSLAPARIMMTEADHVLEFIVIDLTVRRAP